MSLSTYTELKAAVARWLRRDDLTADIPDFILMAEAQINRRLRVDPMVQVATAQIAAEYGTVPGDMISPIAYELTNAGGQPIYELQPVSQNRMVEIAGCNLTAQQPRQYAIVGEQFRYTPVPDQAYTALFTYWKRLDALSDTNASNWLLARYPDAYLYGTLLQTAPFLKDDDRLGTWGALFKAVLDDIEDADRSVNATELVNPTAFLTRRRRYGYNIYRGY